MWQISSVKVFGRSGLAPQQLALSSKFHLCYHLQIVCNPSCCVSLLVFSVALTARRLHWLANQLLPILSYPASDPTMSTVDTRTTNQYDICKICWGGNWMNQCESSNGSARAYKIENWDSPSYHQANQNTSFIQSNSTFWRANKDK